MASCLALLFIHGHLPYGFIFTDLLPPQGTYFDVILWSAIEPNVGVVSACLPSYRPLFKKFLEGIQNIKKSIDNNSTSLRSQGITNDGDDFVRLRGTSAASKSVTNLDVVVLDSGNRLANENDPTENEADIPMGVIRVRNDIDVQSA